MRRLLVLPFLASALFLAGCPKQSRTAAATPAPSPTPEPARGRVSPDVVPAETMLKAANGWNGTYQNLLAVIYAPEDKTNWSQFSEYGWKDAFPYKTYGPQPAGWWVYVEPFWFIWDTRNGQREEGGTGGLVPSDGKLPPAGTRDGFVDPSSLPGNVVFRAALGADAKYSNMLAAIQDPEAAKSYRSFSEFGWKPTGEYKTYGQAPAGFWVYVEPYWIVWNLKDGKTGP